MQIEGMVCSFTVNGQEDFFFVIDRHDVIQCHHAAGRFYEPEELAIIAQYFPRGGVFLDVGANVGNHAIYLSRYLHPSQVILVEPNPVALPILRINIALNGLGRQVDMSHLGVGLSDTTGKARALVSVGNLGLTKLLSDEHAGNIPLVPGDDLFAARRIDFVKIDVEGMEMSVLTGLAGTIAKWRPALFIEVENSNVNDFLMWLKSSEYKIVDRFRRYEANENYMVVPAEFTV